jgi:hypothetical protein
MAAIQLNFALRATANVQTVHLIGSWDGYQGQLPLSRDTSSKKAGAWTGTFRFQSSVLKQGQRYWFYYMMDGYHVSHDPSREFTVEPTTGRKLNVLDVPAGKSSSSSSTKRASRRYSRDVPQGRGLPAAAIQSPMPQRPGQTAHLVQADYTQATLAQLTSRFSNATLEDDDESDSDSESDDDSNCPSLSSGSSRSSTSSPSSVSSSSSACSCERYGITRSGQRVKLDCGGSRCGSDQDCSSESEAEVAQKARSTRRHGVVIRG